MAVDAAARHHRTMPTTTAPAAEPTASEPSPSGDRFFDWMRAIDIRRQPGWIGGVCAGIAARLGIDPLIVRGVLVVIAVLGGPVFLFYAAAWLLLADHRDKIHLEQLLRGNLESPIAGIGVLVLLAMLPVTQGFWFMGSAFWGQPYWDAAAAGRVVWTLVLLGLIVFFVVWVARHTGRSATTLSPATTDAKPDTIPQPWPEDAAPPAAPAADASDEELAAWRERQKLWKEARADWRAQHAEDERAARARRVAEARERSTIAAAESAEEARLWRLANPRLPASIAFIALGAATVAGGLAALGASTDAQVGGFDATIGLAVAALVLGVFIIAAGLFRRRSGVLSFFATVLLIVALLSAAVPPDRQLLVPGYSVGTAPGSYAQPFGDGYIYVDAGSRPGVVDYWQGAGTLNIYVMEGAAARIEVVSRGEVRMLKYERGKEGGFYEVAADSPPAVELASGEWVTGATVGDGAATTIRVWQGRGAVLIYDQNLPTDETTQETAE